jgi:hypothetical protein
MNQQLRSALPSSKGLRSSPGFGYRLLVIAFNGVNTSNSTRHCWLTMTGFRLRGLLKVFLAEARFDLRTSSAGTYVRCVLYRTCTMVGSGQLWAGCTLLGL